MPPTLGKVATAETERGEQIQCNSVEFLVAEPTKSAGGLDVGQEEKRGIK